MNQRSSGIVMPVTSLPGPYGIGAMGVSARRFVDFLQKGGQRYWQVLPLSPTGFGDSPYQSCSAFAGNPYLIDLTELLDEGLLLPEDLDDIDFGDDMDLIDYGKIYKERSKILHKAFVRGHEALTPSLEAFRRKHRAWLPDYALFMACKESFGMVGLKDWPDKALLAREKPALKKARQTHAECILYHEFVQYLFYKQWTALKQYANDKNVLIVGDMPIYVAEDSAEVWASPQLFLLDAPAKPSMVAGVPPDLYSASGQLWGNPLYDWDYHESTGYAWWASRVKHAHSQYDMLRIDHFRGFYNYWAVRAKAKTAMRGRWLPGPGLDFVNKLRSLLPPDTLIAEDLGDLDDKVRQFFRETELPGMNVMVYAFNPHGDSPYAPHNIPPNSICYTSTHDSPTFLGWLFEDAGEEERAYAMEYLRLREDEGLGWGAIKAAWGSPARMAMAPLQDILSLGNDARVNTPSTLGGRNWRWRVREEALNDTVAANLRNVTVTYRRVCG